MAVDTTKKNDALFEARPEIEGGLRLKTATLTSLRRLLLDYPPRKVQQVKGRTVLRLSEVPEKQMRAALRSLPASLALQARSKYYSLVWDGKLRRGRHKCSGRETLIIWDSRQKALAGLLCKDRGQRLAKLKVAGITVRFARVEDPRSAGFASRYLPGQWFGAEPLEGLRIETNVAPPSLEPAVRNKILQLAAARFQPIEKPMSLKAGRPEMVVRLMSGQAFAQAWDSGQPLPPQFTVQRLLELLCQNGGQASRAELSQWLDIPLPRLDEILEQVARLFCQRGRHALTRSFDGQTLQFELRIAMQLFEVEEDESLQRRLEVRTAAGEELQLRLPTAVDANEQKILSVLARYGQVNERDLVAQVGSRRAGIALENLRVRLERHGWRHLRQVGEGDCGRIYRLDRAALA